MANRDAHAYAAVFCILWVVVVFGTCTYVVFWKDASGWWYLLAFIIAGIFTPKDDA